MTLAVRNLTDCTCPLLIRIVRVDVFLAKQKNLSRSYIQKLIKQGFLTVNDIICLKSSFGVDENDELDLFIPPPKKLEVKPQKIPLDIKYEDDYLVIVNKSAGMTVHPAPGNHEGTLVNALLYACKKLSGIGGVERPGIVHRLDKDTEGLMIVAKEDKTHQFLSEAMAERKVVRKYLAIVRGIILKDMGVIKTLYGRHPKHRKQMAVLVFRGKKAITHFKVVKRYTNKTLVECTLQTGRTHQLRVHLKHIGHPIIGDPIYGTRKAKVPVPLKLCAYQLQFIHPITKKELFFEIKPTFL